MYQPDIGRWGVIDPLAENYFSISPYVYALNNPATLIDIEGMMVGDPKYTGSGNVVIIIADGPTDFWDTSPLDATGWDYGVFQTLSEAQTWLQNTYGRDNAGLNNLVIRSHGATGINEDETAVVLNLSNPDFLEAKDFNEGKNENVRALMKIAGYLKNDASVLFTACGASQLGNKLANSIFRALNGSKKNLTLYTNGSSSQLIWAKGRRVKVGAHLNVKLDQWKPWTATTRNGPTPMTTVPGLGSSGGFIFIPTSSSSSSSSSSSNDKSKKQKDADKEACKRSGGC